MTADGNAATTDESSPPALGMTHWDRVAQTNWGRYLTEVEKQVILRGESLAEKTGKAVDLGCGGGRWSKLLSESGWDLTCTDVNSHSLAVCRQNVPAAKCILADPDDKTLPLESKSASLALCIEVVQLIEADWFPAEAHRVLTDNGIFIGVYINGRSWRGMAWRLKRRLRKSHATYEFYRASYPDWRRRLLETGFELLHEESCCWGPFSRDSNSPFVPACAKVERALGLNRVVSWSPWVVFIARKIPAPDAVDGTSLSRVQPL